MGLNCKKQIGKFRGVMKRMENELEFQKKIEKEKKKEKSSKKSQ